MLFLPQKTDEKLTSLQLHEKDSGSEGVKICLLCSEIKTLELHLKQHKKDNDAVKNITIKRQKLKSSLRYLKRSNFDLYQKTIKALGLKDVKI